MRGSDALFVLIASAIGCSSAVADKPSAPTSSRAPYEMAAPSPHAIEISVDPRPAREILESLSRPRFESSDVKVLEDLPAVRMAIGDSGRSAEIFERDFASAFDASARTAVFDFHTIRDRRERWKALLEALESRRAEIARVAARRAAALIPPDRPVRLRVEASVSFGLAGLADHLVGSGFDRREILIIDLARTLGDSEGESLDGQLSRVTRLIAGETYRQGWNLYRQSSPSWNHADPSLGEMDLLLRSVAESGPVWLFTIDENFFPLSVWLKEPMKRAIEDFNRRADRVAEAQGNLEARVEMTAEMRRPEFRRRLAGPAGAFLTDAVVQTLGLDAFQIAMAKGPRAFFEAYDRASQANRALIPLPKSVRERLNHVS